MPNPVAPDYLAPVEEIARGAGAILMRHFRRLASYDKKGAVDLLTIADRESEEFVVEAILARYPDHAILAEEGGRRGNAESPFLWVVDPLDGTTNFVHGLRIFCVSIALMHEGKPIAGCVYAPALDECYCAARGNGATRNGERIHVSPNTELIDALVVTGFPANRKAILDPLVGMVRTALEDTRGVLRLGAAAIDFSWVAAGHLDAFYEYGIKPWDMAAGWLLVEEAGGRVTGLSGELFDPFRPRVLASNGGIHDALLETLKRGGSEEVPR